MSPLQLMDDVCIVGTGLAVPPYWCSSENENSLASREKEDKKKITCDLEKKRNAVLTASPLGPIIPG